jgi:hypothetical protein
MSSADAPAASNSAAASAPAAGAGTSERELFARRMHRRQRIRRGVVLGLVVGSVAAGYLFLRPWVAHYRTEIALGASGFAVEWLSEPDRGFFGGYTAVHCGHHGSVSQPHDKELGLITNLMEVEEVNLAECMVSEAGLSVLGRLPGLQDLNLSRLQHYRYGGGPEPLGDGCLTIVQGLTRLRRLSLAGNRIHDQALGRLSGLANLEELDLSATEVTDAGLEHLRALGKLTMLNLGGTRTTPQGVKTLKQALPAVEISMDLDPETQQAINLKRSRTP